MNFNLAKYMVFIFDLDGCIYSGNTLYSGSKELIEILIKMDKQIVFVTNNSREISTTIRTKLSKMGLPVSNIPILAATELVGSYLFERYGVVRIKVIGSIELEKSLKSAGHTVLPLSSREQCDFVVVGRDTSFNYEKLYECTRSIIDGGKLVATNLDLYHPDVDGKRVPETGGLIAAIKAVSGIDEVELIGKPSLYPYDFVIKQKGFSPESCVMIGDNPYTDIQGACSAGVNTVWISHGEFFPNEFDFEPNFTVNKIEDLLDHIVKDHE